jgi:hypothetical protein
MTTVYIVSSGCKYEGGTVDAVFSSPTLACLHAESLVAEKQQRVEENNALLRKRIVLSFEGENERYRSWGSADEAYEGCKQDAWAVEDKSEGGARCIAAWSDGGRYVSVEEWTVGSVQP